MSMNSEHFYYDIQHKLLSLTPQKDPKKFHLEFTGLKFKGKLKQLIEEKDQMDVIEVFEGSIEIKTLIILLIMLNSQIQSLDVRLNQKPIQFEKKIDSNLLKITLKKTILLNPNSKLLVRIKYI